MIARTLAMVCVGGSIALASFSDHAVVKEVSFKGNRTIPSRQLEEIIKTRTGSIFKNSVVSEDILSILSLYHQRGFYFAEIHLDTLRYNSDSNNVAVSILISEGPQLKISEISIEGNSAISVEEILEDFRTRKGNYLWPAQLEEDMDNLIGSYGRIGFPFASVKVKDISLTAAKNGIIVAVGIDEGKKVTIDEILVQGNTTTDDDVIIRESRLKLHETYDSKKIEKIPDRLKRLNIFSQVGDPEIYTSSYGGGVAISVAEGKTATFSGIVGYAPSGEGAGTFTGIIDIGMRNLFGTGRKLRVRWSKDERKSQDIHLNYLEPWIFNYPLNISVIFDQRQQDSTYVRRGVRGQTDLLVDESLTLGGVIGQQSVIPSDNTTRLDRSSAFIAGLEIGYDTRDQILNPLSGLLYATQYHMERKKADGEYTTLRRIGIDLDVYIRVFKRQVIHAGLHGKTLSGGGIEIGDLYRFGGTNTFRGYRENQFIGKDIAWTNLEYRLILESRSFVYGFFDTGYYLIPAYGNAGIFSARDYLFGYGAGIRFGTAIGNISLSFGFGEGDSFYDGKVHLGIINEF